MPMISPGMYVQIDPVVHDLRAKSVDDAARGQYRIAVRLGLARSYAELFEQD